MAFQLPKLVTFSRVMIGVFSHLHTIDCNDKVELQTHAPLSQCPGFDVALLFYTMEQQAGSVGPDSHFQVGSREEFPGLLWLPLMRAGEERARPPQEKGAHGSYEVTPVKNHSLTPELITVGTQIASHPELKMEKGMGVLCSPRLSPSGLPSVPAHQEDCDGNGCDPEVSCHSLPLPGSSFGRWKAAPPGGCLQEAGRDLKAMDEGRPGGPDRMLARV
ncbi:hypothetical protein TREES_T100017939 [Tupaia chinensis]|uniref:Uncharacterized protein n=1 Tax=Tupaia chinensis TaxID=246437 RepID=L9JQU8_TUPCH|nr:hypothetical protein TREES_T100017939 [Tupaia chinensis]